MVAGSTCPKPTAGPCNCFRLVNMVSSQKIPTSNSQENTTGEWFSSIKSHISLNDRLMSLSISFTRLPGERFYLIVERMSMVGRREGSGEEFVDMVFPLIHTL